jgi:hypothetical protein
LIKFKIDYDHFPSLFDPIRDACLAIKTGEDWVCIGRALN